MIKENKDDSLTNNNSLFKELCSSKLKRQPGMGLLTCVKGNSLVLDISLVSNDDIDFLDLLFTLSFTVIRVQGPYNRETDRRSSSSSSPSPTKNTLSEPSLRSIFKFINKNLQSSPKLKTLQLQHLLLPQRHLLQLRPGLQSTKSLLQLSIKHCSLTHTHLQGLTRCLIRNQSLVVLNLSHNLLSEVGEVIGKILSEHSQRRNEKLWMYGLRGELPEEEISDQGICEVNLEYNRIDDRAVFDMMKFLRFDNWTRSINLRHNQIEQEGVKEFVALMKRNKSLIALDLRGNPGLDIESSKKIFNKLIKNIHNFKSYKQNYGKKVKQQHSNSNVHPASKANQKHHTSYATQKKHLLPKQQTANNTTSRQKRDSSLNFRCENCRQSQIHLLQAQKRNMDMALQNRRLKQLLLPKIIQVSAINPPPVSAHNQQQYEQISVTLRNLLLTDHSEHVLSRIQFVMAELTRILQGTEQQTQTILSNPLSASHTNNLSNTVQILARDAPNVLQRTDISGIQ